MSHPSRPPHNRRTPNAVCPALSRQTALLRQRRRHVAAPPRRGLPTRAPGHDVDVSGAVGNCDCCGGGAVVHRQHSERGGRGESNEVFCFLIEFFRYFQLILLIQLQPHAFLLFAAPLAKTLNLWGYAYHMRLFAAVLALFTVFTFPSNADSVGWGLHAWIFCVSALSSVAASLQSE